ncbi:unnamed protein product [Prunus armeniaca]|uniref:Uncharacterized protein n=1 Tax=Prunus armeniaca TaxID=36596 RepID=A0A6J5U199_PRUAR|nr:unnamed protein product [Prunus armeniaca]CAB4298720.1 unnamed protein product [Prunus armeniaca]
MDPSHHDGAATSQLSRSATKTEATTAPPLDFVAESPVSMHAAVSLCSPVASSTLLTQVFTTETIVPSLGPVASITVQLQGPAADSGSHHPRLGSWM